MRSIAIFNPHNSLSFYFSYYISVFCACAFNQVLMRMKANVDTSITHAPTEAEPNKMELDKIVIGIEVKDLRQSHY